MTNLSQVSAIPSESLQVDGSPGLSPTNSLSSRMANRAGGIILAAATVFASPAQSQAAPIRVEGLTVDAFNPNIVNGGTVRVDLFADNTFYSGLEGTTVGARNFGNNSIDLIVTLIRNNAEPIQIFADWGDVTFESNGLEFSYNVPSSPDRFSGGIMPDGSYSILQHSSGGVTEFRLLGDVSAVPEPASWSLMIAGLLALLTARSSRAQISEYLSKVGVRLA